MNTGDRIALQIGHLLLEREEMKDTLAEAEKRCSLLEEELKKAVDAADQDVEKTPQTIASTKRR